MDNNAPKAARLITFTLGDYWIGIPMASVLRVVNCPPPDRGGNLNIGVVQLGEHTVRLLNLRSQMALPDVASPNEEMPFLLVIWGLQQSLWGIALDKPPELLELPADLFKPVESDKRLSAKLQWFSHIAAVTDNEMSGTLMVLDLKAVFQAGEEDQSRSAHHQAPKLVAVPSSLG